MRSSRNYSANNTYIATSNRHQEISKDDDIKNDSNTGNRVKLTKLNKTNSSKINNSDTRKKISKSSNQPPKNPQKHAKKYDNVTLILEDSMVMDL